MRHQQYVISGGATTRPGESDDRKPDAHLVFSVMSLVADNAYAVSELKEPEIFLAFS